MYNSGVLHFPIFHGIKEFIIIFEYHANRAGNLAQPLFTFLVFLFVYHIYSMYDSGYQFWTLLYVGLCFIAKNFKYYLGSKNCEGYSWVILTFLFLVSRNDNFAWIIWFLGVYFLCWTSMHGFLCGIKGIFVLFAASTIIIKYYQ